MACYHPVRAYMTAAGEVLFSEDRRRGDFVRTVELPCGQCIGCRLERSRQWSVRCLHESKLHSENCFLTLTYDGDHLPSDGSLNYEHFPLFMRKLRLRVGRPVRFYMCGEYGEVLQRPHYHCLLFGFDWPDKKLLSRNKGHALYTSEMLSELWPYGASSSGAVSWQSAAYCARYIVDKITGDLADKHYAGRMPEFNRMSLKPGLGYEWFKRYWRDWYPEGKLVVDGKKQNTPRYYDKLYRLVDPYGYEQLQYKRYAEGVCRSWDNTDERLSVREVVMRAKYNFMESTR